MLLILSYQRFVIIVINLYTLWHTVNTGLAPVVRETGRYPYMFDIVVNMLKYYKNS